MLTIKDNGRGFEREKIEAKSGMGLNGIAERAKILGGSLSIDSVTGVGTSISVEIPLQEQ
jgi:signal transduction histidine kinase